MEDRRIPSSTRSTSSEIVRTSFTVLRKGGVDPQEVQQHLEAVAREVTHLEQRLREAREQLSDAERRAANPVLDEATLASALGAQSAAILRSAHEEAARVTAEAQERGAQIFTDTQQRGADHLIEAQERATALIADAEATATQIDHDSRLAAERLIDSAKLNGDALVERGREQGRAIVEQAHEARRTVLNDLAVKRRALHIQIDQLRAARDTLATFVQSVRDSVDTVLSGINGSDEAARHAALEALRLRPPSREPTEEELLAGTPLREVPAIEERTLTLVPSETAEVPKVKSRRSAKTNGIETHVETHADETLLEDDPTGTDVVNEIFARLRKATLDERGAQPSARKVASTPAKVLTVDDELFKRRDAALEESLAVLTRKVKRALQDDQNIMLERLRDVRGPITIELEDEHTQRARYADAAFDALVDAAAGGSQFAFDEAGYSGEPVSKVALDDCAADLAVTIALALRKRIVTDTVGDGSERVNSAYKEWRGARIERLCTDAARRAFHLGVLSASRGHRVRFFAAPNDAPCDLCARDASAGERNAGQAFPSGSAYPPLHAGCACAVVPV
jgi:cell division septum initiation protein DivIVA